MAHIQFSNVPMREMMRSVDMEISENLYHESPFSPESFAIYK